MKQAKQTSSSIVEAELESHLNDIEKELDSDILVFKGPIYYRIDDVIRDGVEWLREGKKRKDKKLVVVLETTGGDINVTERIANVFRKHYARVEFIIPNFAMSAGTILVLSGDAIHMDYYSTLGPIDPQVKNADGNWVPALGYLAEYERLIKKASAEGLTTEETTYLVRRFDPAELYSYKQARDLTIKLLEEWLVKYKFRNWKETTTRKLKVTPAMRRARASDIARELNKTDDWCSHGRGISMEVLRKKLNLRIDDIEENQNLNDKLKIYYKLLEDYMDKLGQSAVLHVKGRYIPIF